VDLVVRLTEALIFATCVFLIFVRYRAAVIRIVPADVLLWTVSLFFVAPLAADAAGVVSPYQIYPTLGIAFEDPLVRVLAAVSVLLLVLFVVGATRKAEAIEMSRDPHPEPWRKYRYLWLALSFLPPLVVLFAPDPSAYLTFGAPFVLRGIGETFHDPQGPAMQYHILVTWSAYASCLAFAFWIQARHSAWAWLAAPLVLYIDLWIIGKRHIIAMFVLVVGFAVLSARPLPRARIRRLVLSGLGVLALLLAFSSWYQASFRPQLDESSREEIFLTDYTRLDVVRLALASQTGLGDVPRPLEYPGQSLMLHLEAVTSPSREEQLVSYAERVTTIAMGKAVQPIPGAMTTSLPSEAIDNFGVLGLLLGPALLAGLAVAMSYRSDPPLRIIGALALGTLCVLHVLAVLPIVLLAIARFVQLTFWPERAAARASNSAYSASMSSTRRSAV
jgi:hypothetical protein